MLTHKITRTLEAIAASVAQILSNQGPSSGGTPGQGVVLSVQTSTTGTNFVPFPTFACTKLVIINTTGFDLQWRRNGTGAVMPLVDRTGYEIERITNADQISIRRADGSNTQLTIAGDALP